MKVLAYYALHYGREYLDASIRSIDPCVDEILIFYSPKPTHGFSSAIQNPESREELHAIAHAASNKVRWIDGYWGTEGAHRSAVFGQSNGFDIIMAVDADEVWNTESLEAALKFVEAGEHRLYGVNGYLNFWRCFDWICLDGFRPVRFTNTRKQYGQGEVMGTVYHFSTAQSEAITRYKYSVFGHANEMRKGWIDNTLLGWKEGMGDLHPVSIGLWNAVKFDKNTLPEILKAHPNFKKTRI